MKQFIPNSNKGFTLIELVVSGLVSLAILGVSLSLINTQRHQFLSDQTRNEANQNLRAALDLIGADIKVAGERFEGTTTLPVVRIFNGTGTDGAVDEHDRLVLQRNLLTESLTVCSEVSDSNKDIVVATSDTTDTCLFSDEDDGDPFSTPASEDALTDSLNAFKNARCAADGVDACKTSRTLPSSVSTCDEECTIGLIVDADDPNENEVFFYAGEQCVDADTTNNATAADDCVDRANGEDVEVQNTIRAIPLQLRAGAPLDGWVHSYAVGSKIYLFEEREYRFERSGDSSYDGILNLVINRHDQWKLGAPAQNSGDPLKLVNRLLRFELAASIYEDHDSDPTTALQVGSFNPTFNNVNPLFTTDPSASWTNWQLLSQIDVNFEAENPSSSDLVDLPRGGCPGAPSANRLCLSSRFFPRNALSK